MNSKYNSCLQEISCSDGTRYFVDAFWSYGKNEYSLGFSFLNIKTQECFIKQLAGYGSDEVHGNLDKIYIETLKGDNEYPYSLSLEGDWIFLHFDLPYENLNKVFSLYKGTQANLETAQKRYAYCLQYEKLENEIKTLKGIDLKSDVLKKILVICEEMMKKSKPCYNIEENYIHIQNLIKFINLINECKS